MKLYLLKYLSEYFVQKKTLYLVMEIGSTDLSTFFKREIKEHRCVREPTRSYYLLKMLEALQEIHKLGMMIVDSVV